MAASEVLLVEDDFLNRRLTRKALQEHGFTVIECKNYAEAIALLRKHTFVLAILDIHLGEQEQDGITLGAYIDRHYQLPFLYLTAYDNSVIMERALTTMPQTFLTKPFRNTDLIAAVELAIRKARVADVTVRSITVKDEDYSVDLAIQDIQYIESDGNYLNFHTAEKVYRGRWTIKQILEQLPAGKFTQVHRAFIVNKAKIEKYKTREVIVGGTSIPMSKPISDV